MKHSIWKAVWDLAGREPAEITAILRGLGPNACNLARSCHGSRVLPPGNRCHTVHEQHAGAGCFPAQAARHTPSVRRAAAEETASYSFSMASNRHFGWLRHALRGERIVTVMLRTNGTPRAAVSRPAARPSDAQWNHRVPPYQSEEVPC